MEKYAKKFVCITAAQTLSLFVLGTLISIKANVYIGLGYILMSVANIGVSLRLRCTYCWYYGKRCMSGFGWLASKIFSQQKTEEFKNPLNVMITAIIGGITSFYPIVVGIFLLIGEFSVLWLTILLFFAIIALLPNFFIRPKVCANCKQGELGCPAYDHMKEKKTINETRMNAEK